MDNKEDFAAASGPMQTVFRNKEVILLYALQGHQDALDLLGTALPMFSDEEFIRGIKTCFVALKEPEKRPGVIPTCREMLINEYDRVRYRPVTFEQDLGLGYMLSEPDIYGEVDLEAYKACLQVGLQHYNRYIVGAASRRVGQSVENNNERDNEVAKFILSFLVSGEFDSSVRFDRWIRNAIKIGHLPHLESLLETPEISPHIRDFIIDEIKDFKKTHDVNAPSP